MTRAIDFALAVVVVFAILFLNACLDGGPSETDAAAAVALDLNDAIRDARVASKESK